MDSQTACFDISEQEKQDIASFYKTISEAKSIRFDRTIFESLRIYCCEDSDDTDGNDRFTLEAHEENRIIFTNFETKIENLNVNERKSFRSYNQMVDHLKLIIKRIVGVLPAKNATCREALDLYDIIKKFVPPSSHNPVEVLDKTSTSVKKGKPTKKEKTIVVEKKTAKKSNGNRKRKYTKVDKSKSDVEEQGETRVAKKTKPKKEYLGPVRRSNRIAEQSRSSGISQNINKDNL